MGWLTAAWTAIKALFGAGDKISEAAAEEAKRRENTAEAERDKQDEGAIDHLVEDAARRIEEHKRSDGQ